jgi:aryl-alcohol dehydrogenase-like predicted oxidoreductase
MRNAILNALELGYRHFDTSSIYETEKEIGEALNIRIGSGDLKREDVFVTTKVRIYPHRRDDRFGDVVRIVAFAQEVIDLMPNINICVNERIFKTHSRLSSPK